jgi:hypothetical protein
LRGALSNRPIRCSAVSSENSAPIGAVASSTTPYAAFEAVTSAMSLSVLS